jgi:hypothetical protein
MNGGLRDVNACVLDPSRSSRGLCPLELAERFALARRAVARRDRSTGAARWPTSRATGCAARPTGWRAVLARSSWPAPLSWQDHLSILHRPRVRGKAVGALFPEGAGVLSKWSSGVSRGGGRCKGVRLSITPGLRVKGGLSARPPIMACRQRAPAAT